MTATLSKKDRLRAVLTGDRPDRVPVSLWGHDYPREWTPEGLVRHTLESYRAHDWDFIKLNPRWTVFGEAWGNAYERPRDQTSPKLKSLVVPSANDLPRIQPLDPEAGALAEPLQVLDLMLEEVGDEVDVVYTLFSPLATLGLLCGGIGEPLLSYAREDSSLVHTALAAVETTLRGHAEAALRRGATGIFFAPMQWASRRICTTEFYREYGRPYDLQLLHQVRSAPFNILHACGEQNMLNLLLDYPVAAYNWDDQGAENPGLREIRRKSGKVVMGGIDHNHLDELTPEEVAAHVRVALSDGRERVVISGGCAIPPHVSKKKRDAVVAAVREASGQNGR